MFNKPMRAVIPEKAKAKPGTAEFPPSAIPMDPNGFRQVACLTDPAQHIEDDNAGNFRRDTQAMLDDAGPHVCPRERRFLAQLMTKAVRPHPSMPCVEVVVMTDRHAALWEMLRDSFVIMARRRRRPGT